MRGNRVVTALQARCNRVATAYRVSTATPTKVRIKCAGQLSQGSCLTKDLLSVISLRSVPGDGLKSRGRRASHKCHLPCSALHWRPRVVVQRLHGSFDEWWQPACSHAHSRQSATCPLHARYTPAICMYCVCGFGWDSVAALGWDSVATLVATRLPLGWHSFR